MKNNNTNNTNMMQAMAQAMAQGNFAEVMQAIMAQAMQAGMAQGIMAGKAQAQGIEWQAIERQNERHTVWAVRQAMVQGKPFESLVKAWIVLNEKKVPADERVRKVCDDMRCACLHAKGMKVKDAQDAHFEVASMVTVKRAFYCAMRGMPIVETRHDAEPKMRGKKAQGK